MKKTLTLSLGLFALFLLTGCTKLVSFQQDCESLNSILQQDMLDANNDPTVQEGGRIYENNSFYSTQSSACYESEIRDVEGIKWYQITKIIKIKPSGDRELEMTGNKKDLPNILFSASCVTNEDKFVNDMVPDLTGNALDQSKKESLCVYNETQILEQYHNKIQELIGK